MMSGEPYNPTYWQALIAKLMQCIPPTTHATPPKEDKLADGVARRNRKTYSGSYDPVDLKNALEAWRRIL